MSPREPDSWDDRRGAEVYDDLVRRGALYPVLARRLVELLAPRPGHRVLDLATGTGLVVGPLLARVGRTGSVVGLDAAPAMLGVAARRMPLEETSFVAALPTGLPFASARFDGATCSAAFWHFPGPAAVFADLARILRPGARFAFNVPAAQLLDIADLPPAPLQIALAREGERRTGRAPDLAGPVRERAELLADAVGFSLAAEAVDDHGVSQRELADLLAVPAIGARLWPGLPADERRALVDAAGARVDLDEVVPVRWWSIVLTRT